MSAWALQDKAVAQESWESVFDRAWSGEPQFLTRNGAQAVVVVSVRSYKPEVPKRRRVVKKNPKLSFSISDEDLFADDSSMWEACDDAVADA